MISRALAGRMLAPALALGVTALLAAACLPNSGGSGKSVVIYASVDQVIADPVLKAFEAKTGIKVKPAYGVEASMTTDLVNRLIAERSRPQADVWWSGEFAQTVTLSKDGLLAAYRPSTAEGISANMRAPDDTWVGFGGRARVFLVNTQKVTADQMPSHLDDLLSSPVPAGQIGMAVPLFGTTATQAAALYAERGASEGRAFYEALKKRGIQFVDGNAAVRELVAKGELSFGLTDTDDACEAISSGAPVKVVFPDQGDADKGTLVVPATVALVAGGPRPDEGKALVDYLASPEVEADLLKAGWFNIPSRDVGVQPKCYENLKVKAATASLTEIADQIGVVQKDLETVFAR